MGEAAKLLKGFARHPGDSSVPIPFDWQTLCKPFRRRIQGPKQVTDAYLLGLALREQLILVTLDKGIVHRAAPDHSDAVRLLQPD